MKSKINSNVRTLLLLILLVSLFTACTNKITFINSSVVPSAEGTVRVKQGDNNNYNIDLNVKRLASPSRLTPPQNVYVVWMETSKSGVHNIGQLQTASKGLSTMLSSSLKTVTPYKPTGFFITAEEDASGNNPGMTVVLKTSAVKTK